MSPTRYRYEINYGFWEGVVGGTAELWTDVGPDKAASRFHSLALDCFGLRKSFSSDQTEVTAVHENEPIPEPWDRFEGAHEMLVHRPHPQLWNGIFIPGGEDRIIWDAGGTKVKSEWD